MRQIKTLKLTHIIEIIFSSSYFHLLFRVSLELMVRKDELDHLENKVPKVYLDLRDQKEPRGKV